MDGPRFAALIGVELALWERPGSGPAVVFCHATGFHARCWNRIVEAIPDSRCIAMDMRGHGLSTKPQPPIPWRDFGNDVAAVARELALEGAIGVGHSMGGHSLTLAAALCPGAFSALLLLDPVILPPRAYTGPIEEPHFARKRRARWPSRGEMFERFHARPPFDSWDPRVLRDYCDYGLNEAPDGNGFVLACPPEIEGAIYEQSRARESDIGAEIEAVRVPVVVMRAPGQDEAGQDVAKFMAASPTDPALASRFHNGRDMPVRQSHFIPMEAPGFVAEQIRLALAEFA